MLLVSSGLVATFAMFLFLSFAGISQGNGNQPRNGVGARPTSFSPTTDDDPPPSAQAQPTSLSPTTDDDLPPIAHGASTTLLPIAARQGKSINQGNVASGTRKFGPKVVGGTDAQPGSWPWQVLLYFKERKSPVWCGGSILTPYWVVTAAHCFDYGNNSKSFTLTVGEHNLGIVEGTEQIIPIDKIILHPNYDWKVRPKLDYDVALIKLRNPINFTSNVRPVLLPTMNFLPGTNCYITGWGDTKERGNISQILQQAQVPLISRGTCRQSYQDSKIRITKRMRCAGFSRGGVDACEGDSGGPLVCPSNKKWYLMGIISFGVGCARPNRFGVYSDMWNLKTWVQDTITTTATL